MVTFNTEQQLAAHVVDWLRSAGWTVYQEVAVEGRVADIVARKGRKLWVIETKRTLGLDVVAQAMWYRDRAHMISVAVPATQTPRSTLAVLNGIGLGALEVSADGDVRESVTPRLAPPRFELTPHLRDEQQDYVQAGSARGGHVTEFADTRRNIEAFVEEHPGCTVIDVVNGVEHHYYSNGYAAKRIDQLARKGVFGFERRGTGKNAKYWPED